MIPSLHYPWAFLAFMYRFRSRRADQGETPKTIHAESTILRQVVNHCRQRNLLFRNALAGPRLTKLKPRTQPCRTREEVQRILPARIGLPRPIHTLRHSFISHATSDRVTEWVLRARVGHVDGQVIRGYWHIAARASLWLDAATARLGSRRSKARASRETPGQREPQTCRIGWYCPPLGRA
jgi:hypothetical protein